MRESLAAQLRLTAAERRLQAHQEAFAKWRKLLANVHDEKEIGNVVTECLKWWENNCLYLVAEARETFLIAIQSASDHRSFKSDRTNPELVIENWNRITRAGKVIVSSAQLPSFGQNEWKILEPKDPGTS